MRYYVQWRTGKLTRWETSHACESFPLAAEIYRDLSTRNPELDFRIVRG